MKIALIHHQLRHGGGMETYCLELIHALSAAGHQVSLWVMAYDPMIALPAKVKLHVLPQHLPPRFLQKYYFAWQVKRQLKRSDFDRVISLTRSFSQNILVTGGTHKGYQGALGRHRLKDWLEAWLEAKAYRLTPVIIAHSPTIQAELLNLYGLPAQQVKMSYPPVDTEAFEYQKHEAPAPHTRPLQLLFVSTSHRRKGGYLLLEALKQLPPEQFALTIAGRPFKAAERLSNVRNLGYVEDIAACYHAADLLVLPSYFEPFGLVIVQALACGTPVLVSRRSGAAALVGPEEGLILEEQTPEALAALLLKARDISFNIPPNFAQRNGLTWPAHLQVLLENTHDS
jgi:glycosyltransferase involved in cell wall biosynthesis